MTNAAAYSKGILSEILDFVMGQGLIPANGEVWKTRRRAIVPSLHKCASGFGVWDLDCAPCRQSPAGIGLRGLSPSLQRAGEMMAFSSQLTPDVRRWAPRRRYIANMIGMFGECSMRSVSLLEASIAAGTPVEMENFFSRLTLDIIGRAVFNYNFDSLTHDDPVIQARPPRGLLILQCAPLPGACNLDCLTRHSGRTLVCVTVHCIPCLRCPPVSECSSPHCAAPTALARPGF